MANYHLTLQFPSALQILLAFFSSVLMSMASAIAWFIPNNQTAAVVSKKLIQDHCPLGNMPIKVTDVCFQLIYRYLGTHFCFVLFYCGYSLLLY